MAISGSSLVASWGAIIRIVEKDVLDSFVSSWNSIAPTYEGSPPTDYYKYYALDEYDPLAFWVFPIPVAGANIVVTYAKQPAEVTAVEDELELSDEYIDSIVDYVVYRSLSKESRADAGVIADKYLNRFLARLGASRQIVRTVGQNTQRPPDAGA
jgi:hypothetical protein